MNTLITSAAASFIVLVSATSFALSGSPLSSDALGIMIMIGWHRTIGSPKE